MDSKTDYEKAQDELIDQHVFYVVEDCSQGRKHIYSLILRGTPEEPCVPLCDDVIPFMSQTFDAAGTVIDVDGPGSGNASLLAADTRGPKNLSNAIFLALLDGQKALHVEWEAQIEHLKAQVERQRLMQNVTSG
jgi:hypothetical protein